LISAYIASFIYKENKRQYVYFQFIWHEVHKTYINLASNIGTKK
jgi:hypothetical protein